MTMMRMLLEIVMVFGLLGGIFYVNQQLAKESRENRARAKQDDSN